MIQTVAQTFDQRKQMYLKEGKDGMLRFIKNRSKYIENYSEDKLAELLAYWEIVIDPCACKEVTDKLNKEQNIEINTFSDSSDIFCESDGTYRILKEN